MADAAANILAPAVESALKNVGVIIKRQLIYLLCFTRNIKGLEEEAENLTGKIQGVNAEKDQVTNNGREIHPEVTVWLQKSYKYIEEKRTILNEVPNATGGCLRFATRFSLSRRAIKTTEAMTQLRENCNFKDFSLPRPAVATKEIPLGTTYAFDSRKKMEQQIMTTLREKKDNVIAIHGMGGLGKTTMAIRIMNALLKEQVFDEVVIAVVSKVVDKLKIQLDIGGPLGLKDLKKDTAEQARTQILHARLCATTTRTLLVLDDVWEKLDLEDLGIPCSSEGCTILITSRNSDALTTIDSKNIFEMKQLSEDEAWFMFKEKAGTCVEDKKLMFTAKEVMRECKGLPIALLALGASLKDEKRKNVWKDTLKRLRKPNPRNTPTYISKVYNALIVSYDKLDEEFKTPFLLCCLFPEDKNIFVGRLTYFCMGLRLFDDLESLGEVRDRMFSLVKMLKSRSLLLDGFNEYHVRLHDVVRDVCIFIAKQKRYIGGHDCTWISNSQRLEKRTEVSTNLRLLISDYKDDEEFRIDNTFFEGIRELYVLSIARYSWTSLPNTQSLNHLRTLLLDSCYDLKTISVVGSLVHLEILSCRFCNSIKELPEEIKVLKHLKLVELIFCENLQSIGQGIISSLDELEELRIWNSFHGWGVLHLRELEALKKLRCLDIQIRDRALIAEDSDINLSSKLEQFDIRFYNYNQDVGCYPERFDKNLMLLLDEGGRLGHWIRKLLKDTEYLNVQGNGADFQISLPNIQWLKMEECGGIKNIATTSGALLEHLELWDLPQLEEIWNGPANSLTFLQNFKEIKLWNLPSLKHLWKSNTNIVSLPQLEILEIDKCEMMEQLFVWSEDDENEISNKGSPNSTQIDQGVVKFPLLQKMKIIDCPKMRSITRSTDDHSSHLFCQPQKVSFGRLKELSIESNPFCHHIHIHVSFFNELEQLSIFNYHGSMSLFTVTLVRNLVNLKELHIEYCDEMVALMEDDKKEGITVTGGESNRPFPNLRELRLRCLRKLVSFCNSKSDVELSSLKRLDISECPNTTTNISLGPLALEEVKTDLDSYLGVLFKETGNHPSCSLHESRIFSFVNSLQTLHINQYKGSTSIFSTSIVENLINLRTLDISGCDEMVKVIEGGERSDTLSFPKLQTLELVGLPKLEIFCEWKSNVELPLLKELNIRNCPNMTKFTLGSVITPCLNFVTIDRINGYSVDGTTDLNGVLKQHFIKEKEIQNEDEDDDENRDREGDASNGGGNVEIEKATNEESERKDGQSTCDAELEKGLNN